MNNLILSLIPILFLSLLAVALIYLSRRLAWAYNLPPMITTIVFCAVVLFFVISIMLVMRNNLTSGFSHLINNISSIGFGVLAILLFVMLAADLVQLVIKMQPKVFGGVVLGVTLAISLFSLWNAQNVKTYHQEIVLPNLVEPLRIAQLSDIHIGHFWGKRTVDRLVRKVQQEDVDAVVITGDMFDGRVNLNPEVLEPFGRLSVPIYFVEGNHDGYSGSDEIKQMLSNHGIIVLDNRLVDFKGLQIVGLDYLMADDSTVNTFHAPPAGTTIQQALPRLSIDKSRASLMLHHNPVGAKYASENGINLYLAGHTHAGQMFPATLIAKAMFEFNKGLYKYDDTLQVYVSQGSGTFGPPMRLGTHSELTILNLIKK